MKWIKFHTWKVAAWSHHSMGKVLNPFPPGKRLAALSEHPRSLWGNWVNRCDILAYRNFFQGQLEIVLHLLELLPQIGFTGRESRCLIWVSWNWWIVETKSAYSQPVDARIRHKVIGSGRSGTRSLMFDIHRFVGSRYGEDCWWIWAEFSDSNLMGDRDRSRKRGKILLSYRRVQGYFISLGYGIRRNNGRLS